eukprot:TRINITY_DN20133_c0_g1_i2.p1 TRINITY_DN20133_c0_g1~~TRINITY_DN20133_c0_g1_i2.p1  ORF type:complete len:120 (-),score=30.95 TRINITY_DN20133_c0_g1_i2:230-589(-)
MIRRPPRSTLSSSSAASDVYKRQVEEGPSRPTEDYEEEIINIFRTWDADDSGKVPLAKLKGMEHLDMFVDGEYKHYCEDGENLDYRSTQLARTIASKMGKLTVWYKDDNLVLDLPDRLQ